MEESRVHKESGTEAVFLAVSKNPVQWSLVLIVRPHLDKIAHVDNQAVIFVGYCFPSTIMPYL